MADRATKIEVCAERDWQQALSLVLQPLAPNLRGPLIDSLARLKNEPLGPLQALVVARQDDDLVGALWAQPQPGRTASVWLPQFSSDAIADVGNALRSRLLAKALEVVDASGVVLCQALLENQECPEHKLLLDAGFAQVAELQYMAWDVAGAANASASLPKELSFTSAAEVSPEKLEQLVQRTYAQTLDCPELDGLRAMPDVLSGYRQTGDHDPELWQVIRHGDHDAGVLLLTEHRTSQQLELIYMGIVPEHRGFGLGRMAVERAQMFTQQRGADRLVLAVDARNSPARDVYQSAGFDPWASRLVYVRSH